MATDLLVALDPFAKNQVTLTKAMATTKALANQLTASIEPVAVVSPDQLHWPTIFDGTWASQFEVAARDGLKKIATSTGLNRKNIEIVTQPTHSLKASVSALADFAQKQKPLALTVFTHNRKGNGIRLFGSFATGLLAKSPVPLFFVNARGRSVKKFKKILFATDLSPEAATAFRQLLPLAAKMQAEVVLFHALTPIPSEVISNVGVVGGMGNYEMYVRDEEAKAQEEAQRLVKQGEGCHVETSFTLHHTTKRPAQTILDAATRFKADMICVCSKTTGAASFILGSVTRDVLEDSKLPVFVIPAGKPQ